MSEHNTDIMQDSAARIAGASWLIIIVTGICAEFFIRMPLIVPGDTAATAANIVAAETLFRLGIAADMVMLVFDAVAAAMLFVLFKPVHFTLTLLGLIFRLIMNAVLAVNLVNLALVLVALNGGDSLSGWNPERLQGLAMFFLDAHGTGYDIALIFFGLHCLLLGYLIFRSGYVPKLLGILLLVASVGYLIDSFAHLLLPAGEPILTATAGALIGTAVLAELSLSLWLLIRGIKRPAQKL